MSVHSCTIWWFGFYKGKECFMKLHASWNHVFCVQNMSTSTSLLLIELKSAIGMIFKTGYKCSLSPKLGSVCFFVGVVRHNALASYVTVGYIYIIYIYILHTYKSLGRGKPWMWTKKTWIFTMDFHNLKSAYRFTNFTNRKLPTGLLRELARQGLVLVWQA